MISEPNAELLAFALAHPWAPAWPEAEIRAFLGRLISGPDQIIEVSQHGERQALAVLLDKVSNPGRHACLEFLGIVPDFPVEQAFGQIMTQARQKLGPGHRGIQIGQHQHGSLKPEWLEAEGCELYYRMFEMQCDRIIDHLPDQRARMLIPDDFEAYYELLCRAFAANPDTSISDYASARRAFEQGRNGRIWMIWQDDKPVAFVHLLIDQGVGEIRTLGVDPSHRGGGLGRALLGHALAGLAAEGLGTCRLSVAAANDKALDLYRKMGFAIVDQSACWLWQAL